MRPEPTLAYTVHHNGQIYLAGMTAEEIGPDAGEIGAHAWEDGIAPKQPDVPPAGPATGGTLTGPPAAPEAGGSPVVPAPPGPAPAEEPEEKSAPAKRAASNRRGESHD